MHSTAPTLTYPTRNKASIRIPARRPTEVFDLVTDIGALPGWNDLIAEIVERPAILRPGAVWKVRMQQGPMSWTSRSTVVVHDRAAGLFIHRSGTDDGNPSYTEWRWTVAPDGDATILTVSWKLRPATRFRRLVMAPYRARRLRREVPTSLDRLATVATAGPLHRSGARFVWPSASRSVGGGAS